MNPTKDIQTPVQLISRALLTLDKDLRQVLVLHNGNGDTPGLPFEALTDRLDRPSLDLIAAEKTALRNLRRPPMARLMVEALRKSDKVIWQEIKKWNSSYYLRHDCKHRIWSKIPPLRELLALSVCISRTAGMNWIRVNRAAGYYLFDQHSITHLAIMIALGALKSTDHWQNPHQIGPAADYLFKKLMDAFQADPTSNWDSDVGLELRKHLLDIAADQDLGWVNVEDLALLSKTLAGEPFIPPVDEAKESKPAPNLLPKQLELPF
jgi:hypothetical protein